MPGHVLGRYTQSDSAGDRTGTVRMPIGCILANTIEPFVCRGDAALCQITLTTCYHHHHRRRHHHHNPLHSISYTQGTPVSKINDSNFKAKCLGSSSFGFVICDFYLMRKYRSIKSVLLVCRRRRPACRRGDRETVMVDRTSITLRRTASRMTSTPDPFLVESPSRTHARTRDTAVVT